MGKKLSDILRQASDKLPEKIEPCSFLPVLDGYKDVHRAFDRADGHEQSNCNYDFLLYRNRIIDLTTTFLLGDNEERYSKARITSIRQSIRILMNDRCRYD